MTIQLYNDRSLIKGQKVRVYKNLHKDCYSILDHKTGLVVAYADSVCLKDVQFRVRKGGQRKARQLRVRNVHAFALAFFEGESCGNDISEWKRFTYNPFIHNEFVDSDTGHCLYRVNQVFMDRGNHFYFIKED